MSKKKPITNPTKLQQIRSWNQSEINRQTTFYREKKVQFDSITKFLDACIHFYEEEIDDLLESGVDVNCADKDHLTALHQACINNRLDVVEFLLKKKADINVSDREGWTPLHIAADIGSLELSRFLIENGARLDIPNNDGDLPIMNVDESDFPDLKKFFKNEMDKRKINADECSNLEKHVMMKDIKRWRETGKYDPPIDEIGKSTPIHVAASKNYVDILVELMPLLSLEDINAQDADGWTALHAAAHWGHKEACIFLINNGADPNIRTRANETVMDMAEPEFKHILEEEINKYRAQRERENIKIREIKPDNILRTDNSNRRSTHTTRSSIARQSQEWKKNTQMKDPVSERHTLSKAGLNSDGIMISRIDESDEKPVSTALQKDKLNEDSSGLSLSVMSQPKESEALPIESFIPIEPTIVSQNIEAERLSNPSSQTNPILNGEKSTNILFSSEIPIFDSNNGALTNQICSDIECDSEDVVRCRGEAVRLRPKSTRDAIISHRDTGSRLSLVMAPAKSDETEVMRREKSRLVRSTRRSTQAIDLGDIKVAENRTPLNSTEKKEAITKSDVNSEIQTNSIPLEQNSQDNLTKKIQINCFDKKDTQSLEDPPIIHNDAHRNGSSNVSSNIDHVDSKTKVSPLKYQTSCPDRRNRLFTSENARFILTKKLKGFIPQNDKPDPTVSVNQTSRGIDVSKCLQSEDGNNDVFKESSHKSSHIQSSDIPKEKDSGSFVARPVSGSSYRTKDIEIDKTRSCSTSLVDKKLNTAPPVTCELTDNGTKLDNQISKTVITKMLNSQSDRQALLDEVTSLKEEVKQLKDKLENNTTSSIPSNERVSLDHSKEHTQLHYESEIAKLKEENKILKTQKESLLRVISKIQQELEEFHNLKIN